MTRTGRSIAEWAATPQGIGALASFCAHLGPDSLTWREEHPADEAPRWTARESTNAILADIYDALAALNGNFIRAHSKRRPKPARPYPRPNAGKQAGGIGTADVRAGDFDSWWESGE